MIRRLPHDAAGSVTFEPGHATIIPAGTVITMDGGPHDGATFYVMRDVTLAAPGGQVATHVEQLGQAQLLGWRLRWWLGRTWLGRAWSWLATP